MRPFDSATVAALRHRNFRLLWLGQLVSMSGSMMQTAAILWQALLLGSGALLVWAAVAWASMAAFVKLYEEPTLADR